MWSNLVSRSTETVLDVNMDVTTPNDVVWFSGLLTGFAVSRLDTTIILDVKISKSEEWFDTKYWLDHMIEIYIEPIQASIPKADRREDVDLRTQTHFN